MNFQHTIASMRLLAAACLLSSFVITFLTCTVKGSSAKTDDWSNAYSQHLYSDLTGTIHELTSNENNDDTDTRFQPPLDTDKKKTQPTDEGYRLASTELSAPPIALPISKDVSPERNKRDVLPSENSTTSTISMQPVIQVSTEPLPSRSSTNTSTDGSIISDADANSWADILSLSPVLDGSGIEPETTSGTEPTSYTYTAASTIQLTTFESTTESTSSSASGTTSSMNNETEITTQVSVPMTEETSTLSINFESTPGESTAIETVQTSSAFPASETTTATALLGSTETTTVEMPTMESITESTTSFVSNTTPSVNNETEITTQVSVPMTEETSTLSVTSETTPVGATITQGEQTSSASPASEILTITSEIPTIESTTESTISSIPATTTSNYNETNVITTVSMSTTQEPSTASITSNVTAEEFTITTAEQTSLTSESSPTTTTTSIQSTQTEAMNATATATPISSSTNSQAVTESTFEETSIGTSTVTTVSITSQIATESTNAQSTVVVTEQTSSLTSSIETTQQQSTTSETATVSTTAAVTMETMSASESTLTTVSSTPAQLSTASTTSIETSRIMTESTTLSTQSITTGVVTETSASTESTSSSIATTSNQPASITEITTSSSTQSSTATTSFTQVTTQSPPATTSFFLHYTYNANGSASVRSLSVGSPSLSAIQNDIANILYSMNVTCNDTCIQVNETSSATPPDVELLVNLNVSLDTSQRIVLVNDLFINNVTLNDSYRLTVRIVMNPTTTTLLNFTTVVPACKECEYDATGVCDNNNTNCICNPNYEGLYCRNPAATTASYLSTSATSSTSSTTTLTSTITSMQTNESLTTIITASTIVGTMSSVTVTQPTEVTFTTAATVTLVTSAATAETASTISSSTAVVTVQPETTIGTQSIHTSSISSSTAMTTAVSSAESQTSQITTATITTGAETTGSTSSGTVSATSPETTGSTSSGTVTATSPETTGSTSLRTVSATTAATTGSTSSGTITIIDGTSSSAGTGTLSTASAGTNATSVQYTTASSISSTLSVTSITSSITSGSLSTGTSISVTTISTTTTTTATTTTTTATLIPQNCVWTLWSVTTSCSQTCGEARRTLSRSCIDSISGLPCNSVACGAGNMTETVICSASPPCETIIVTPTPSIRNPGLKITSYALPNQLYFFDQYYTSIWITNKGYVSLGTPFYSETMTEPIFRLLGGAAIIAPFWANLVSDNSSSITTNWFSSLSANQSDLTAYNAIIRRVISDACPRTICSQNPAAVRAVRINWQNFYYISLATNQTISVSFSTYLINVYDTGSYSYPVLDAYVSFDYTNLTSNLGDLKPFVGYRGSNSMLKVFNQPDATTNAVFLTNSSNQNSYIGSILLTQCYVSYLKQITYYNLNPSENLNDDIHNPRFPCPCTIGQARSDRRFSALSSENKYERSQNLRCYAPISTSWIRVGFGFKLLKSQTCCYKATGGGLITDGEFAGSVLLEPSLIFALSLSARRISFHDQCCAPTISHGIADWNICRLYYELNPASRCTGYRPTTMIFGNGDPHVNTVDNGQYTCHIQGVYIFARTTSTANATAQVNNNNNGTVDSNLILPEDLFEIRVRAVSIPPVLSYVEREAGDASLFSSYSIFANGYTFNISNINGQFGFVVSNGSWNISYTSELANNLNYDSAQTVDTAQPYFYRVVQTNTTAGSLSVPAITVIIWSGLSMQCQIVNENLDCILSLPEKYRSLIEGLAGNFNGNYSDDLVNRGTSQSVTITSATGVTSNSNDSAVLNACLSWKAADDLTPAITQPIMPSYLVNVFYYNNLNTLVTLNPLLSATQLNTTCAESFECRHDYIVRINQVTSGATTSALSSFQQSVTVLAQQTPTVNITSSVQIAWPYNNTDRHYILPITISGATSTMISISQDGVVTNSTFNNQTISIPMPTNISSYVQVSLTMNYGVNSTVLQYLDIVACLCVDPAYCNYLYTNQAIANYALAQCSCPDQYSGDFCQSTYNACSSNSACKVNWENSTICIAYNASQQLQQGQSFTCIGSCVTGYISTNNYTCDDINECAENSTRCGSGTCVNTPGSYLCNCNSGYKFANLTCVGIDKCTEPNVDGTFNLQCNDSQTMQVFAAMTPVEAMELCHAYMVLTTLTARAFVSRVLNQINRTEVMTITASIIISAWCSLTCPGYCELMNNRTYQCNCWKSPGLQISPDGTNCLPCDANSYGYNCSQQCACAYGTCISTATNASQSCSCQSMYAAPFCSRLIDVCALNNTCNNATQDCTTDPASGNATCSCKLGYQPNGTICIDIDECTSGQSSCSSDDSSCNNTIGSYICSCLPGFQSVNGSCTDINECDVNPAICSNYSNTYCANIRGSYQCRCNLSQTYANVLNTNSSCLPIDYSSFCQNQCLPPATCSASTGRCACPLSIMSLVAYNATSTNETCVCPNDPFLTYNGSACVSSINDTADTQVTINFMLVPTSRNIALNSTTSANMTTKISNFFLGTFSKTCSDSCIRIYNTKSPLADLQLFVLANVSLTSMQRIQFVRFIFSEPSLYNDSYSPTKVAMIIDTTTNVTVTFATIPYLCDVCSNTKVGTCNANNDGCNCLPAYQGQYCDTLALQSSSDNRSWTIIVAVVSAVAGLLLIISLVMCIFFCKKRHEASAKVPTSITNRPYFTIPRAHIPTSGKAPIFTLDNSNDESYTDAPDSIPSSSNTTYNVTYRTNGGDLPEANFSIFDALENGINSSKGHIPRPHMIGMLDTLNSLPPHEHFGGLSEAQSTFSDSQDINDIELVTDMLDDMTKDDDMEDEFVEALNPNLALPRSALQPETKPSGWFGFFRNS
ncbi:unnamed protein product [Rotaria magnacalcarata]|uniref:EGF-like domain-containing protein n=7 Tax=Rotaria magnacalcarata TaxID=392030 RepID=A0A816GZS2_9BILA|nr:unnamed protein product [Rotaria magnacalcarata]